MVCHALSPDLSGLTLERHWPEPHPPGPGEVTVRMLTVALNFPDMLMLRGGYQFRPQLPFIPGTEGCGVVVAAGQGSEHWLGHRVITGARQGLLAERVTLAAAQVRAVPPGLDDLQAAAFTVGALTAWVGLMVRGRLRRGERVLVTGAGGGMGLAAVALAVAEGAHVTAVASSAQKLELARAAGAHDIVQIDRAAPEIAARGIDLVFDPVGGALFMPALRTLARGGRHAIIGFTGGQAPPLALNRALLKEIEIIGVRAGEHGRQDPAAGAAAMAAIDARAEALKPHIGSVFALADGAQAIAGMAAGVLSAKTIIKMAPNEASA
nr:zinc-binding dehydrogenase [Polymorphobacter multimanifer]